MTTQLAPSTVVQSARRLDIQGLRAVAVLAVVLFHAGLPLPGGFIGVDVFFVISGFVITAMLMRQREREGGIRFGTFYLRRFLRLTPALALTVTVVVIASFLLQNPFGAQQTTARTGIGAMLISANLVLAHLSGDYFAATATTNPLLHTWSLSVEEQFYLFFPALLGISWWLVAKGRRHAAVLLVSAVAIASLAASIVWSYGIDLAPGITEFFGGPQTWAYFSPLTRSWEFAVGALLALLLHRMPAPTRATGTTVSIGAAAVLAGSLLFITESMAFPGIIAALPVLATAALIWIGSAGSANPVSKGLSTPAMVSIGDWSYSWYLWHWPLIVFAALLVPNSAVVLVIAAAFSIIPALASYRFVEQPLRRLRPRSRAKATGIIGIVIGVPLLASLALLIGANTGWGLAPPTPIASNAATPQTGSGGTTEPAAAPELDGEVAGGDGGPLRAQHAAVAAGCVNTDLKPRTCRFGPPDAADIVLVAGDSQAYAVADGVIPAAAQLGLATVVTSHTGCPFLGRESSGVHNYPCGSWQQEVLNYALDTKPAAVVIVNRTAGYLHPEWDWRTAETDAGKRAASQREAQEAWRAGMVPILRELEKAGVPVIIVGTVPEMTGYTDQTSVLGGLIGRADFEISREKAERDHASAVELDESLAREFNNVTLLDPVPLLCGPDTCAATDGDIPIYQDETHLAVPGAERLTGEFVQAIRSSSQ